MGAEIERKGRIDVGRALKLRMAGLSYQEIGNALGGFSDSGICDALQGFTKLLANPESISAYRQNEAEMLDAVRWKLISSLPDDLDNKNPKRKLSGYQKVGMYGILFDKMRLLRGESTANVHSLTAIIQAALGQPQGRELPPNEGRNPQTGQVIPAEDAPDLESNDNEIRAEDVIRPK